MTKHAVLALTHAAKFAGWENGVRVTALCPGAVDTDLVASIPGVTPSANRIAPETIGETVSFLLRLPNTASVAELVVNTRLETLDLRRVLLAGEAVRERLMRVACHWPRG